MQLRVRGMLAVIVRGGKAVAPQRTVLGHISGTENEWRRSAEIKALASMYSDSGLVLPRTGCLCFLVFVTEATENK